jgi:hypothetical protein
MEMHFKLLVHLLCVFFFYEVYEMKLSSECSICPYAGTISEVAEQTSEKFDTGGGGVLY